MQQSTSLNLFLVQHLAITVALAVGLFFSFSLVELSGSSNDLALPFAALFCGYIAFVVVVTPTILLCGRLIVNAWVLATVSTLAWSVERIATNNGSEFANPSAIATAIAMLSTVSASLLYLRRTPRGSNSLPLTMPISEGTFCAVQGGQSRVINHHRTASAQRYAVDLVKVGPLGSRRSWAPSELKDFVSFGAPVQSPCEGTVIEVSDGQSDNKPGTRPRTTSPAGNFVRLKVGNAEVVLAHLKCGSIEVTNGQKISMGTQLGLIGNSGNSSEPHLHIHGEVAGRGIALRFDDRFLVRNSIVRSKGN